MKEHKEYRLAQMLALHERPYLARSILRLRPVKKDGIKTISGDMWWRVYYDPEYLASLKRQEQAGAIVHIVTHLLRAHADRAEQLAANSTVWSIAADAEINDDVLTGEDIADERRMKLPEDFIQPQDLGLEAGQLVEVYYRLLEDNVTFSEGSANHKNDEANKKIHDATAGLSHCGSCASGRQGAKEWEEQSAGKDAMTKSEAEAARRDAAHEIQEYGKKSRGTIPAGWERWAEKIINPRIPWWKELPVSIRAGLADVSGMVDYTYRKPSRRQSALPQVVLPALRKPRTKARVYVDTSGSMGEDDLGKALGTIQGVLKDLGPENVRVCSVDAAVHTCQRAFSLKQVKLMGGGGTDMCEVFTHIKELPRRDKPDLLVIVTDGYTPWPETVRRDMKVVTLLTSAGTPPPFGKVIQFEADEAQY